MPGIALASAEVLRCGETARYMRHENRSVQLWYDEAINLDFSILSKGGGTTEVRVRFGQKDFEAIINAMLNTDRNSTMIAMTRALLDEIEEQPDRDAAIAKSARNEIVEKAYNAWMESSGQQEKVAEIIHDGVKELVDDMNE